MDNNSKAIGGLIGRGQRRNKIRLTSMLVIMIINLIVKKIVVIIMI